MYVFRPGRGSLSQPLSVSRVEDIRTLSHTPGVSLVIRQGNKLAGFEYDGRPSSSFQPRWNQTVLNQNEQEGSRSQLYQYPWTVSGSTLPHKDVIIIRNSEGVLFFRVGRQGLDLLTTDTRFHDVYGWRTQPFLFGNIIPSSTSQPYLGVVGRDQQGDIKIFIVNKEVVEQHGQYPLWELQHELNVPHYWKTATMFLTNWKKRDPVEAIGIRHGGGLEFYQFDSNSNIQRLLSSSSPNFHRAGRQDRLLFGQISPQGLYQDAVKLNDTGVYLFSYDQRLKDYGLINMGSFNQMEGWSSQNLDSVVLTDINGDGRDDLIFTGVRGLVALSFDQGHGWLQILDTSELNGNLRYSRFVRMLPSTGAGKLMMFVQDTEGVLHWGQLVSSAGKPATTKPAAATPTPARVPQPITTVRPLLPAPGPISQEIQRSSAGNTLRWAEKWDNKALRNIVDSKSGQILFSLPLVDTDLGDGLGLKIHASYSSASTSPTSSTSMLGTGWSISPTLEYVYADYSGIFYEGDVNFYLVTQNGPLKLIPINSSSPSTTRSFKIRNLPQIIVSYDKATQRWTFSDGNEQVVYGSGTRGSSDPETSLQWSLGWNDGRNDAAMEPIVVAWYLNSRRAQDGVSLSYHYEHDTASFGSKNYTSAIRLKRIQTQDSEFTLEFQYLPKNRGGYKTPRFRNPNGDPAFPVPLVQSKFLGSYKLKTPSYEQFIRFEYNGVNGNDDERFLHRISQQMTSTDREILFQFEYIRQLDRGLLSSIKAPDGVTTLSFTYAGILPPVCSAISQEGLQIPVPDIPQAHKASDYSVVTYIVHTAHGSKARGVHLRIMNPEMTKVVAQLGTPTVPDEASGYFVIPRQNLVAIHQVNSSSQALYIFTRSSEGTREWMRRQTHYEFASEAVVRVGASMIVAQQPNSGSITILTYNEDESDMIKTEMSLPYANVARFAVDRSLIVGYSDPNLWILYRHQEGAQWFIKVIANIPGAAQALSRFELDHNIEKYLNSYGLQVLQNNLIMFTTIQETNGQVATNANFFALSPQHNVSKQAVFQLGRLDVRTYRKKQENDGSTFTLKYFLDGRKYRLKIVDISGKIMEGLDRQSLNSNIYADGKNERIKALNDQKNMRTDMNKIFDPLSLHILRPISGSQMGWLSGGEDEDKCLYRLRSGVGWEKHCSSSLPGIPLGDSFLLVPNTLGTEYKLYAQNSQGNQSGNPLRTLIVPGKMVISRFPHYLAYSGGSGTVHVLLFGQEGKEVQRNELVLQGEKLLSQSTYEELITLKNATDLGLYPLTMVIRSISSWHSSHQPALFVKEMELATGQSTPAIKTSFERRFASKSYERTCSQSVTVIPGSSKDVAGWQETSILVDVVNKNSTTTERYFNADGQIIRGPVIKTSAAAPSKSGSTEDGRGSTSLPMGTKLTDRSENLVVADFSPLTHEQEMTGYCGFEDYELSQAWTFPQSQIIRNKFSFTGRNFLLLNSGQEVTRNFKPSNQDTTYVASCWIRSEESPLPTMETKSKYLKVMMSAGNVEVTGLHGQVRNHFEGWYYHEIFLDFDVLKKMYGNYYANASTGRRRSLRPPSEANFAFKLVISAGNNSIIHVDDVRFTPLAFPFEAYVFEGQTRKPTAIIKSNGLPTRIIYDRIGREIGSLSEDGKLERVTTTTLTGRMVPLPRGQLSTSPSRLLLVPIGGHYESFNSYGLKTRWQVQDDGRHWRIAPGQLIHVSEGQHELRALSGIFDSQESSVRLFFHLQSAGSSVSLNWPSFGVLRISRGNWTGASSTISLPTGKQLSPVPNAAELIVKVDGPYMFLWVDGVLFHDGSMNRAVENPWSNFSIKLTNRCLIEDLFVLKTPELKVQYLNGWGETVQTLNYVSPRKVVVSGAVFDSLGREAINLKSTEILRKGNEPLLAFRTNFVTNIDPSRSNCVWRTGRVEGEVNTLNPSDNGHPFARTVYAKSPLNQEKIQGLPGMDYSVGGTFAKKFYHSHANSSFISNLFPPSRGYRYRVEEDPNGTKRISVHDWKESANQVALYVSVSGYNHLFSTFEYDSRDRLVKVLPPNYHRLAGTASKTSPWQPGESHLSRSERDLQEKLGSHFSYSDNGNLVRKKTPDAGLVEYVYNNEQNLLYFSAHVGTDDQVHRTVYYKYDEQGQLIETGRLLRNLPLTKLQELASLALLASPFNREPHQIIGNSDDHWNPVERRRQKQFVTHNQGGISVIEDIRFDTQGLIISKSSVISPEKPRENDSSHDLFNMNRRYVHDRLVQLEYPSIVTFNGEPLRLLHEYNRLGQLVQLKTPTSTLARFEYTPTGQLSREINSPGTTAEYTRLFAYNSPGFLVSIQDPFLKETVNVSDDGYGQAGFGDGIVMSTAFNATWPSNADTREFRINSQVAPPECISSLKRLGYLRNDGRPLKVFSSSSGKAATELPLKCGGNVGQLLEMEIGQKFPTSFYGHRYSYGNHKELLRAKYFTQEDYTKWTSKPFKSDTFAELIPEVSASQSRSIWAELKNEGFILTDTPGAQTDAIGKPGESIFRDDVLTQDLRKIGMEPLIYLDPIKRLLSSAALQKRDISIPEFESQFLKWYDNFPIITNYGQKMGRMLGQKGYLQCSRLANILNPKFASIINKYPSHKDKIFKVLVEALGHALGSSPFDLEAYKFDGNGNRISFYSGFDSYGLQYKNGTNQVDSLTLRGPAWGEEQNFSLAHDSDGNVVSAAHRGIRLIEYHPVSQRVTSITLKDGHKLCFTYDAQGERVLKQFFDENDILLTDVRYLRDEKGRVLVDRRVDYLGSSRMEQVTLTSYIYGPRTDYSLLGFIRNNKFYNVFTDHAGSVRLVIQGGRVVAAYDYLPYGELMRSYGKDPEAHITYRYTGQEWDAETGLYNYHARLYDPSLGRFYQPDPRSQYFSPYIYAGNSPISMVDPDGEEAITLIIAAILLAAGGVYLGGAAANNRWNPRDWDWKHKSTWTGIATGGLAGAMLPFGFSASVGVIGIGATVGLGVGGAYLTAAAANRDWNLANWAWDRPGTYNGLFQGFSTGSGLASGFKIAHQFAGKVFGVGTIGSKVFMAASVVAAGGVAYGGAVIANDGTAEFWLWDLSNPATVSSLINGFDAGLGWPLGFTEMGRRLIKLIKNPSKLVLGSLRGASARPVLNILKDPKHPLYKVLGTAVLAYYMGSQATNEFDITHWDLSSFSTYEGIINGMFFGKDAARTINLARATKSAIKVNFKSLLKPHIPLARFIRMALRKTKSSTRLIEWEAHAMKSTAKKRELYADDNAISIVCKRGGRGKRETGDYSQLSTTTNSTAIAVVSPVQPERAAIHGQHSKTTGPSVLEMGDLWLSNTVLQGNLLWSKVIQGLWGKTRPSTRPTSRNPPEVNNIQVAILAEEILNKFCDRLLKHGISLNIEGKAEATVEELALRSGAVQSLSKFLINGKVSRIWEYMLHASNRHLHEQCKYCAEQELAKVNELLSKLEEEMNDFEEYILQQERKLF